MLAAARQALPVRANFTVAKLEDPLPPGPFDLVGSALALHGWTPQRNRSCYSASPMASSRESRSCSQM